MKILFISGSPRNGNTEYILTSLFTVYAGEKELILLRQKNIKNCLGCLNCQTINNCFVDDDMSSIMRTMENSDLIVFGIPNYFDNVPGLAKTFIDRCHPFYTNKKLKDKKIYYIYIGGGKEEGTEEWLNYATYGFNKYLELNKVGAKTYKLLHNDDIKKVNINLEELLEDILRG